MKIMRHSNMDKKAWLTFRLSLTIIWNSLNRDLWRWPIIANCIWRQFINPRTYTQSYPSCGTRGGGWTPLEFLICCSTSKRFFPLWKASDLFYKMRYILWVVALWCDGRGLWCHQTWSLSWPPPSILWRINN